MSLALWFADLSKLETPLGLPIGYIERLDQEDDWSFVIKAHAVLEAVLGHAIASADPRLVDVFERLPFGGGPASKIGLAKALGILDPSSSAFVARLSILRNRLVHDIALIEFHLDQHVSQASESERTQLAADIAELVTGEREPDLTESILMLLNGSAKEVLALAHLAFIAKILFKLDPDEKAAAEGKASAVPPWVLILTIVIVALITQRKGNP